MSENPALVGADPELFVSALLKDNRGRPVKYDVVPAFGRFGGNKDAPIKMDGLPDGFAYLEDNAALEFNIPPQSSAADFNDAIRQAKHWLQTNKLDPQQLTMSDQNVLTLEPKYQADPRGKEVGCSKDWDAYGMPNGPKERDPFSANTLGDKRYSGGHFHISYNHAVVPRFVAARFCDVYASLPWLEYDRQGLRRTTYGKAGLFRPKDYGLEYRTMSNWWLWHDSPQTQVVEALLTFARRSYEPEFLKLLSDAYTGMPWQDVQKAIENEDHYLARQLIDLADSTFNLGVQRRGRRR